LIMADFFSKAAQTTIRNEGNTMLLLQGRKLAWTPTSNGTGQYV
jgi:hypothetical protein